MARHSFIQMSKLSNVKGRISYISDPKRQEYLYATFSTREDMTFWNDLAKECQEEFRRYGTEGKCIEARELIIALPEEYTQFDPNRVLREFTEQFKKMGAASQRRSDGIWYYLEVAPVETENAAEDDLPADDPEKELPF